jgi:hypothetical protein
VRRPAVGATGNMGSAAAAAMADGGELDAGVGFRLGLEHRSFIDAATSQCAHGLPRRARGPRPRPARSAGGGADGPMGTPVCGHRRTWELHVAVRTSRAASVCAMPWEGAVPRSAYGPDGEAGPARARRGASQPATVSLYPALNA